MIRKLGNSVLFWPDLASCHYTKTTLTWLQTNKVAFVPKAINPPNFPELRPIEKYWALIKRKLLKNSGTARNELQEMKKK